MPPSWANYLVNKGINFREAHNITGKIVLHCIDEGIYLNEVSLAVYQGFSPLIEDDIFTSITTESVVEAHAAKGGTAKQSVLDQLAAAKGSMSL